MMNSFYLRAGAALACAVTLSACGGSDGELLLGGSYAGVTKAGLVLTNGDQRFEVPASTAGNGTGSFYFPDLVSTDDEYDVKVAGMPDNVDKCNVVNGKGRAAFNITTVQVICEFKRHDLKGSISNLKGAGLVLVNGTDRVEVSAGATAFTMAQVPEDGVYGVAILQQPANQNCTVGNGSGTMGKNDITNLTVTCAP
jgi:hypothetical protein